MIGRRRAGDLHVVDVSDLTDPEEVAFFHLAARGPTTSGWTRTAQILYAAYYNGGVVALDVSGELAGDLSSRLIAQIQPGGAGDTYTWGVQLAGRVAVCDRHAERTLAAEGTVGRRLAVIPRSEATRDLVR